MPSDCTTEGHSQPLLSVAPMMQYTDVHYRQMCRLMSKHTWLYTEMIVAETIIHIDNVKGTLWKPKSQSPVVLQLGGSCPESLARATEIANEFEYDEINLNCGCPSPKVAGKGCFGASLMFDPELVGRCMAAIASVSKVPVTVKCRLGADDMDSYPELAQFIHTVSTIAPVKHFILHARKCLLDGVDPVYNRTVPPLRYQWVLALKRDFPHLTFTLNGGINDLSTAKNALAYTGEGAPLGGIMMGRAVTTDPWNTLASADVDVFGAQSNPCTTRRELITAYGEYCDSVYQQLYVGQYGKMYPSMRQLFMPLQALLYNQKGGRRWRKYLQDAMNEQLGSTCSQALQNMMQLVNPEVLDAPVVSTESQTAFAVSPLPDPVTNLTLVPRKEEGVMVGRRAKKELRKVVGGSGSGMVGTDSGWMAMDGFESDGQQEGKVVGSGVSTESD